MYFAIGLLFTTVLSIYESYCERREEKKFMSSLIKVLQESGQSPNPEELSENPKTGTGNNKIVGCKCGQYTVQNEWDSDLGAYYYYFECISCNYYWEGPIYNGAEPPGAVESEE